MQCLVVCYLFYLPTIEIKKLTTFFYVGPDLTVDDRWFNMHLVITADIPTTLGYFYPRLIPIHTLADEKLLDDVSIPDQLRCSFEKLAENGAYILGKQSIFIFNFCINKYNIFGFRKWSLYVFVAWYGSKSNILVRRVWCSEHNIC